MDVFKSITNEFTTTLGNFSKTISFPLGRTGLHTFTLGVGDAQPASAATKSNSFFLLSF